MAARGWKIVAALFALALVLTACSSTPANDFEAGECTNETLTGDIGEVDTVDCEEAHTAEAFAQFDIEGDDFPGDDDVSAEATERCQGDLFEEYVGIDYPSSIYLVSTINPTEETWDNGDRTVICVISGSTEGELEGSAEGSEE